MDAPETTTVQPIQTARIASTVVNKAAPRRLQNEITPFLMEGEGIDSIYGLVLDFACITNNRLLFVDKTFGSKKTGIFSVPISKVTAVALLKGGFLSFTDEVEVSVGSQPYNLRFLKGESTTDFYKAVVKNM